jgi:hypothetical protein
MASRYNSKKNQSEYSFNNPIILSLGSDFRFSFTKVGLGVLPSPMSNSSKGWTDVNPYPNLYKSLNSSMVLVLEEAVALCGVANYPAMGAGPSARVATHYGALCWTSNHPTLRVEPSARGAANCRRICWTPDCPASGAKPSAT